MMRGFGKFSVRVASAALVAGAAAFSAAFSSSARAEAEHVLTISSWAPPTHGINAKMWPKFIEMIEAATDGRVSAELKLGLAPPPAQFDLVQDGAADLTILFHGYQPGRFTVTKLIELPIYEGSAESASAAYWRVHERHLAAANEHRGVKLIALHTHGPAQLHSDAETTSLDGFQDLKIRVPGGVGGDVTALLGATRIQVPAPKVYETLASKAADGVVMPMESRRGFRLYEVARNVYEIPGGLYRGSFAFVMNEDAFAALSAADRRALESEVFGEPLSRAIGAIWDEIDRLGREVTLERADNAIHPASSADMTRFRGVADRVAADTLEAASAKGVDAQAAVDMIRSEMAKLER